MIEVRYRQHTAQFSDEDADLAQLHWRVLTAFGSRYVVRSIPRFPGDIQFRGNQYAHQVVAKRMGLSSMEQVAYADGNSLNLCRENLVPAGSARADDVRGCLGQARAFLQEAGVAADCLDAVEQQLALGDPGAARQALAQARTELPCFGPARAPLLRASQILAGRMGRNHNRGESTPKAQPGQPLGMRRQKLGTIRPVKFYEVEVCWPDGGVRWEPVGTCERVRVPGSGRDHWQGHIYARPGVLAQRFPARRLFTDAAADILGLIPGWPPAQGIPDAVRDRREYHRERRQSGRTSAP